MSNLPLKTVGDLYTEGQDGGRKLVRASITLRAATKLCETEETGDENSDFPEGGDAIFVTGGKEYYFCPSDNGNWDLMD